MLLATLCVCLGRANTMPEALRRFPANPSVYICIVTLVSEHTAPSWKEMDLPPVQVQYLDPAVDALLSPDVTKEDTSPGARQVFEVLTLPVDIFCDICFDLELLSHMSMGVNPHQLWSPPHVQAKFGCGSADTHLLRWPSFILDCCCSMSHAVCWKPPCQLPTLVLPTLQLKRGGLAQFDSHSLFHEFCIRCWGVLGEMRPISSMVLLLSLFRHSVNMLVLDGELLTCKGEFLNLGGCNSIDVHEVFERSCDAFVVQSGLFSSLDWVEQQPWPPPDNLRLMSCDAGLHPPPCPSFSMVERCSVRCYSGCLWKPPWPSFTTVIHVLAIGICYSLPRKPLWPPPTHQYFRPMHAEIVESWTHEVVITERSLHVLIQEEMQGECRGNYGQCVQTEIIIQDPLLLGATRSWRSAKFYQFVTYTTLAMAISRYVYLHDWQQSKAMIWYWNIVPPDATCSFSSVVAWPELIFHGHYLYLACHISQCNTWVPEAASHGVPLWGYNAVVYHRCTADVPNGNIKNNQAGHSSILGHTDFTMNTCWDYTLLSILLYGKSLRTAQTTSIASKLSTFATCSCQWIFSGSPVTGEKNLLEMIRKILKFNTIVLAVACFGEFDDDRTVKLEALDAPASEAPGFEFGVYPELVLLIQIPMEDHRARQVLVQFPWDPGGARLLHRLEGKPKLKKGGMLDITYGWAAIWALGLSAINQSLVISYKSRGQQREEDHRIFRRNNSSSSRVTVLLPPLASSSRSRVLSIA